MGAEASIAERPRSIRADGLPGRAMPARLNHRSVRPQDERGIKGSGSRTYVGHLSECRVARFPLRVNSFDWDPTGVATALFNDVHPRLPFRLPARRDIQGLEGPVL